MFLERRKNRNIQRRIADFSPGTQKPARTLKSDPRRFWFFLKVLPEGDRIQRAPRPISFLKCIFSKLIFEAQA